MNANAIFNELSFPTVRTVDDDDDDDIGWHSVGAVSGTTCHCPGTGSGVHLHTTTAHVSTGSATSGRKTCSDLFVVIRSGVRIESHADESLRRACF